MRTKTVMEDLEWLCKQPELSEKYRGEHIAIVDERVVAHGKDFVEVAKRAEKFDSNPLYAFNPDEDNLIL
jgi:hypothetical protein